MLVSLLPGDTVALVVTASGELDADALVSADVLRCANQLVARDVS